MSWGWISFIVKHITEPLFFGFPIILIELFFLNFSIPYSKTSFSCEAIFLIPSLSIKFIEKLGIKNIEEYENEILEYGIEKLRKNNSVNIIGNPKKRGSVMSFTIKGIHPHDIATILDDDGVAIRAGHHCCQILHNKLGIPATARASIGVYNTKEDIDVLCKAIENCKKVFQV